MKIALHKKHDKSQVVVFKLLNIWMFHENIPIPFHTSQNGNSSSKHIPWTWTSFEHTSKNQSKCLCKNNSGTGKDFEEIDSYVYILQ